LAVEQKAAFTESFPLMCNLEVWHCRHGDAKGGFLKLPRSDYSGFCRIEAASAEERSRAVDFVD
jgi:hypothetical protein